CSSCGALYTTDYCCSEGSLGDKIICDLDKTPDLSQRSPQNCPKCGNPVDGHYYYSEPSNDNTNVVNALQEPFVGNQDPGKNSSQSPPQINHHCCYECSNPLEEIFCHQCTCELCGRGAHYGYNCPPKVPIVSNPEPCHNQTVDELPRTLPSFDPTCYSKDGNSFTYDSTSNLVHESPNIFNPPLQPLTYSYEFCGNDAYYGQECSLQFPIIHQLIREKTCAELLAEEQEANIDTQPFQYSVIPQPPKEEMSVEFLQEKRDQMDSVKTFLRNAAESSSSQNVDPSNMHTFYQPCPHEFQWTKDHPLEQVIEEPSRPVLTRNQLRSDGDMCMYALTVTSMEPKNVKEAMTDRAWIESMQEELLQFKRLDV
nr:Gag-Pol polyprotein [Tanacetum cinerariifolium]